LKNAKHGWKIEDDEENDEGRDEDKNSFLFLKTNIIIQKKFIFLKI
jgi:hypothetical protein